LQYQKSWYAFIVFLTILGCSLTLSAQSLTDDGAADPAIASPNVVSSAPTTPAIESPKPPDKRLFGVLPNYRTANASVPFAPITSKQKLGIASRDSFDWPTYPLAAVMTFAMPGKEEVKAYGSGWSGFANRYVRSSADQVIGNMFTEGFIPAVLHHDPRYFRAGSGTLWSRLTNAVSQIAVAKNDSGRRTFNVSEFLGNAIATGISNTYEPNLRSWENSTEKLGLMVATDMFSNVVKEFGPDVKERVFHRHHTGT
jgi:hypothetical protein